MIHCDFHPAATIPEGPARLESIGRDLETGLADRIRSAAASEGPLGLAVRHHLKEPGKLFRGRLALSACEALGVPRDAAIELAVACELLHNASLVHDDLQDRDEFRRGRPTVWRIFGDAVAVNVGDHLLVRALERAAAARVDGVDSAGSLLRAFTDATHRTLLGQTRDLLAVRSGDLSFAEYAVLARDKTAPLLALPVVGALILAGADAAHAAAVQRAMSELGLAYQIQDDLLELFGLKDRGSLAGDVRHGRPNAVVALHLDAAEGAERARLVELQERHRPSDEAVADWSSELRTSPAVSAAIDAFEAARGTGEARLRVLPPNLCDLLQSAGDRLFGAMRLVRPLAIGLDPSEMRRAG